MTKKVDSVNFFFDVKATSNPPPNWDFSLSDADRAKSASECRLVSDLRLVLGFGRCIGVFPDLCQKDPHNSAFFFGAKFRRWTWGLAVNVLAIILLTITVASQLVGFGRKTMGDNPAQFAWATEPLVYSGTAFFGCIFFLKQREEMRELFQKWEKMETILKVPTKDPKLFRHANTIAGTILLSALFENLLFRLRIFQDFMIQNANATAFDTFYTTIAATDAIDWPNIVPEKSPLAPLVVIFVVFLDISTWLVWNIMDAFLIIWSRILYFKFRELVHQFQKGERGKFGMELEWDRFTGDLRTLYKMTEQVSDFLGPLVFTLYSANAYTSTLQTHQAISPNFRLEDHDPQESKIEDNVFKKISVTWSFFHQLGRTFAVTLAGSRVRDEAENALCILEHVPPISYTSEVKRAERDLRSKVNKVGLSGLGCFYLTKSLILQLLGVIFTIEIVLLQSAAASKIEPINS